MPRVFDDVILPTPTAHWKKESGVTVLSGNAISAWQDCVGGITLSQSTGANRPVWYAAPSFNGHAAPNFTRASTHYLVGNTTLLSNVSGFTMFVVFRSLDVTNNQLLINADGNAPNFQIQTNTLYSYVGAGNYGTFAFTDTKAPHILTQIFDGSLSTNPNRLRVFLDSAQQTLSFTGTIPATTSANTSLAIGAATGGSVPAQGYIAEVIIYNSALTATQRINIERSLGNKFSIQLV